MSREHPDIEILWAVMNGDRIATEDTNYEVSEEDPRLLEQFSACMQASVMSWTADRYISCLYNISCRRKKRSFGQQVLVSEHYLSPEGAELRPAISREGTFQRQHVQ